MRRFAILALTFAIAMPNAVWAQTTPTAREIVAGMDAVRNPGQPYRTTTTLTEYVGGKPHNQDVLVVFAKRDAATQQFRNLVRYVQPARDAGKAVLLDEHILWFYDPSSRASVRISPQQQLLGQASIADVLTVNLVIDYTAALLGPEEVVGANRQTVKTWHLDLKAANDRASYSHVEMWAEQGTLYPIKGKFYADSGRLLKTVYYRDLQTVLGRTRPVEAIIIDAVDTSLVTDVTFSDYRYEQIPDAWFQREYLSRLPAQ